MLDMQTTLRNTVDDLEKQGRYLDMAAPLEELVTLLAHQCSAGICSAPRETPEFAAALDRLAGLHRNLGNLERSFDLYMQALETSATVFGPRDPNYATTLNNYAGLQRLRGEYQAAEEAYVKAESIYTATIGPTHVLTVSALNNRGLLKQDQGKFDEAKVLHEEALERLEHVEDAEVARATTLNNLASVYTAIHDYANAREYMERASVIYRATVGEHSDLYLGQIHNLASMQALSGDLEGALERYEWVLVRVEDMFGPRSVGLASVLRNIEAVSEKLGRTRRAEQARTRLAALTRSGPHASQMGEPQARPFARS